MRFINVSLKRSETYIVHYIYALVYHKGLGGYTTLAFTLKMMVSKGLFNIWSLVKAFVFIYSLLFFIQL